MRFIKIIISYDGTDFEGWQVQPHGKGIANIMQQRFKDVFKKEIILNGASRTDAGVHALGQVATFFTDLPTPLSLMQKAWNDALGPSIIITDLQEIADDFHPRYAVQQKTYHYHFFTERPNPFHARYGWFIEREINFKLLAEALQIFIGTHDFRSFCTGDEMGSTIRTIDEIALTYDDAFQAHCISIKGKGFLRYMIRRIVGACIDVATKDLPVSILSEALAKKDPNQTLYNAPALGLVLYAIKY